MNEQDEYKLPFDTAAIFELQDEIEFNRLAVATFRFQYGFNAVYKHYCDLLKVDVDRIQHYNQIPFLPITFFKNKRVTCFDGEPEITFLSSGTTGMEQSKHHVKSVQLYENSFIRGFENEFGDIRDCVILGLLPSYLEREGSSLIYMVERLIALSGHEESGFFLHDHENLLATIDAAKGKKIILIGVAYALLDFGEKYAPNLSQCTIIETGGMKGKREELIKSELHAKLRTYFHTDTIHSEYGMTELLSQAYSTGEQFTTPAWMKILTRSHTDPFSYVTEKTGGINVIDLANLYSCSFIATQDLGRLHETSFEVVGRFDNSDIRGCNLLVQ